MYLLLFVYVISFSTRIINKQTNQHNVKLPIDSILVKKTIKISYLHMIQWEIFEK